MHVADAKSFDEAALGGRAKCETWPSHKTKPTRKKSGGTAIAISAVVTTFILVAQEEDLTIG
jgi:hypothetical protein